MENNYRIKENGFSEIRKKVIIRIIPLALLAACIGLGLTHYNSESSSSNLTALILAIPIVGGAMAFGLFRGMKRQKDIFESYVLTIEREAIIRQQNLTPDIRIPISEIKEIIKGKNGSLAIKGKRIVDVITVPSQVENIEELELKLSEIVEINAQDKKPFLQQFLWTIPVLTLGLMAILYLSNNKIIVGLVGATLSLGFIYSLIVTQRSKHIDRKTKRNAWFVLIVLFSVITITYFKLIAN